MSTTNSIRSASCLLYLIVFITTGCAEKATKHVFVNEPPPAVELQTLARMEPINIEPLIEPKKFYSSPVLDISSHEVNPKVIIEHKTVWDRLLSLYALPEIENPRIEHELQNYLKYPDYLAKIQQRAQPYLYFILDEIEAKEIPGELALLPVVESAFKPNAISKSSAMGLWQFMPATGRLFGLKQNWWYDGRKDIYKSTKAATSYLKKLGDLHKGNWPLALASYNAGKGTIRKAIRKNKKKNLATDYWSLSLYKETMDYVPKLLAIAKIFAHAEEYNIPLLKIPNEPHFSIVNIKSPLDLDIAAELAEMPSQDFFKLNPAFKRSSIDTQGPYQLLVHTDKVEDFKNKLASTPKKDRIRPSHRHQIKSGENLSIIAQHYKTSVYALRQNNHLASSTIKTGQYLLIPNSSKNVGSKTAKQNKQTYTVKKGDTFWDIARQFAVRSRDIASWNNISLTKALQPGQKLIIEES